MYQIWMSECWIWLPQSICLTMALTCATSSWRTSSLLYVTTWCRSTPEVVWAERTICNYMIFRGRHVVDNALGIMASWWQYMLIPMQASDLWSWETEYGRNYDSSQHHDDQIPTDAGPEVIQLECILKLNMKHNDWLLVRKQPNHFALFWEALKFYNLGTRRQN